MENPILIIIGIAVLFFLFKGGSSKSGEDKGSVRKFRCNECGSNRWIRLRDSYYDRVDDRHYNYKEWLRCAKCGNEESNERFIK